MTLDTLQRLLLRARESPTAGLRFVAGDESESFLSWAEVALRASRVAGGLARLGIGAGERVALVFPTGAGFFDALFGALFAGAVPVPLYPPVRLGRLDEYRRSSARMLSAVDAAVVLVDAGLAPLLGEAVALARPRLGCWQLEALPAGAATTIEGRTDDLALVQFSSGTTAEPKPVALEQRAVLAQVAALNSFWPDRDGEAESAVSWLPLYHDMGLIGCVFPALERPAVSTLLPPERFVANPALWLRALGRHRATISVAPNFGYAMAAERIRDDELAGCDLSRWRVALCGAEAVAAPTLRRFATRFAPWGFRAAALTPVYGLSEAALAVSFGALDEPFRSVRVERETLASTDRAVPAADGVELVSVGRPLPGFALELRDDSGRLVAEGEVGRLFVAGPSLFREYLGQPEATRAVLADGWLDTGDLGFRLDGELYLTGRAKDLLIVRGRNYSPAEVEQAVDAVAGVRRGCAAAVSLAVEGADTERLLLFVEWRRDASAGVRRALADACRAAVLAATGLLLDEVHPRAPGSLPRTSSGKIRRPETLRRHLAATLAPPSRFTAFELAVAWWRGRRALLRVRAGDGRR